MDTAWEKSRDAIVEYVKVARKYKAKEVTPFSQALYLASVESSVALCYGISLAYIVKLSEGRGKDLLEQAFLDGGERIAKNLARVKNDKKKIKGKTDLNNALKGYHDSQFSRPQLQNAGSHQEIQEIAKHIKLPAIDAGMKFKETEPFDQRLQRMAKAADYMLKNSNSYYVITTPNHGMAAANLPKKYYFFDPNLGEVLFTNKQDFKSFFVKWFSSKSIIKAYRGKKGNKLDPKRKEHKTLHLGIDRYTK